MEAMQLNAKECHTKAGSMTVDIELVEVDRRESHSRRAFLTGVVDLVDIKMFSQSIGTFTQFKRAIVRKVPKETACTLSSWTVRAIVTLLAARCADVFKVHRRLVRSITT
jgi:hypothetical protein